MSTLALARLAVASRRRRVLGLVAFAGVFLGAGIAGRVLFGDEHGHIDVDTVFAVGGTPLASAVLLMGWVLGRYPLIATVVMLAGFFSDDRAAGYTRLYAVRPVSPLRVYGVRFLALASVAFLLSAILLPAFDLLLIGEWAGPATFVLILSYIFVYGGLVALLSIWTRGDVWIALFLAAASIVWNAMLVANMLHLPPGGRDFITFVLPPQAAMLALEGAFGSVAPIPWDAFAYTVGYGAVLMTIAALTMGRREV